MSFPMLSLDRHELDLVRRWFNAVMDEWGGLSDILSPADCALFVRISEKLCYAVDPAVRSRAAEVVGDE